MAHYDVQYAPEKPPVLKTLVFFGVVFVIVFFFTNKRFLKEANRDLTERYPTAEIITVQREGYPLPNSLTFICRDSEYDVLFLQNYSRKGTHPVAAEPDAKGYPARTKAHTDCLTQIAALPLPKELTYTVVRNPNDTGFSLFTSAAAPEDIAALLDAMQPETVTAPLVYHIDICAPELYRTFSHADYSALYSEPAAALHSTHDDNSAVLVCALGQCMITGDDAEAYDPEFLDSYTQALKADPQHSFIEISGVLGEGQPEVRLRLIQQPMY